MLKAVFLDSSPLGLVTQRQGIALVDSCRKWVKELMDSGIQIFVPEVADFEIRRELLRADKLSGIQRLDEFNSISVDRYVPINTDAMRRAAVIWADARNRGVPSSDVRALDADVILAAQVLTFGLAISEIVIATSNLRHIRQYAPCELWSDIKAD